VEPAGEIRLDELVGIEDYEAFRRSGGLEYNATADRGRRLSFWDGKGDRARCAWRAQRVEALFRGRHPEVPARLAEPPCA